MHVLTPGEFFVWRPITAKQKIPTLRPLRLCGEKSILDKTEERYVLKGSNKDSQSGHVSSSALVKLGEDHVEK